MRKTSSARLAWLLVPSQVAPMPSGSLVSHAAYPPPLQANYYHHCLLKKKIYRYFFKGTKTTSSATSNWGSSFQFKSLASCHLKLVRLRSLTNIVKRSIKNGCVEKVLPRPKPAAVLEALFFFFSLFPFCPLRLRHTMHRVVYYESQGLKIIVCTSSYSNKE